MEFTRCNHDAVTMTGDVVKIDVRIRTGTNGISMQALIPETDTPSPHEFWEQEMVGWMIELIG